MDTRILTFRVYARNIPEFSPGRDSVFVRGSFNSWSPALLSDAAGNGVYSGNVNVAGLQGEEIAFKYTAEVAGEEVWELNVGTDGSDDRIYILGPSDVPSFVSNKTHIFGSLDPISPRGVRTGGKVVFLPMSQTADASAPCHGWFFENSVNWDGNGGIEEVGVIYSKSPIEENGSSSTPTRLARGLRPATGEFAASAPAVSAGQTVSGLTPAGFFEPGPLFFRAYAKNASGTTYGALQQSIVPGDVYREWRLTVNPADFFVGEDSTPMEKRVILSWEEPQGVQGEWTWEIYRFESSQIDQNPLERHRLLASFNDSQVSINGSRRIYTDSNIVPGWSYLYLIGIKDSGGLRAFRSGWINMQTWILPNAPEASAQSQTPYSLTINFL